MLFIYRKRRGDDTRAPRAFSYLLLSLYARVCRTACVCVYRPAGRESMCTRHSPRRTVSLDGLRARAAGQEAGKKKRKRKKREKKTSSVADKSILGIPKKRARRPPGHDEFSSSSRRRRRVSAQRDSDAAAAAAVQPLPVR